MIIVTGAAGFIASFLVEKLNESGVTDLILVDDFSREDKQNNHENLQCHSKIERTAFIDWFSTNHNEVDFVFHLGARTDTTEMDYSIHETLNVKYSEDIWNICTAQNVPLIYASSAATYGMGEHGYEDNHDIVAKLNPLNPYGDSKNNFDKWVLNQDKTPPFWAGVKFFNVYGPNENHKGRMASVVFHTYHQIQKTGGMKLFRSHNANYKDGEQLRDFIYVKDVVSILLFLAEKKEASGLYNAGTGIARSFHDLASLTFQALDLKPNISFIDTPLDIRDKYQYFTEASIQKLIAAGYSKSFHTLEEGVSDYVQNYLNA
ncbi:MAG: ADP-glyceromanno-heptose 6-epimerase [Crocinitomicaceae bacterium TMED16]|nr:MAG: ADP-glyceromanno-heptose 6-epimerase [Crocinitomicaceae bacterium TMED16]